MYKLLFGFLIYTLSLTAQASGLEQATPQQLNDLKRVIEERLIFFSFLSTLDSGIPALGKETVISSISEYLNKSQLSHNFLDNFSNQNICSKFKKTFLEIESKIANDLTKIQKKKLSGTKHTLLEARLNVLSNMRSQLVNLVESDQEGGVELLTQKSSICLQPQRDLWKKSLKNETLALQTVLQSAFGVRGLREANRLSTELSKLNEKQATSRLYWFLPKTIAITAASLVTWELVIVRGLATLASAGALTPVAAKSLSTVLTVGSTGAMVGIGAYQGIKIATSQIPLLSFSELDNLLNDILSFLELPLNSPEAFFDRVFVLEGLLSKELLKLKRESKPDKEVIVSKWGSIESAIDFHKKKLNEVQKLIK